MSLIRANWNEYLANFELIDPQNQFETIVIKWCKIIKVITWYGNSLHCLQWGQMQRQMGLNLRRFQENSWLDVRH